MDNGLLKDVTFSQVFKRKELWPCFISIFFGLFSLNTAAVVMTVHVVRDFDFDAQIAYYFFAVWSTG